VIEQDYEQDLKAAVVSLEKALTIWPGQIDPSIYFRLETCFQKMGRAEDALRVREKASQLRQVVEVGRIKELREIVLTENFSEANYRKFSEFYDALGRSLEKEAWGNLALSAD
jgi:tetratricopeptide (TPR) repeat protein